MQKNTDFENPLTTIVDCVDDSVFQYEPNRTYRGSARVDDNGNFVFRPYRENVQDSHNMQWLSGGNIGRNYHWALHRGPHSLKVTLTIKDFDQFLKCPKKATEILRNLFVKALYELSSLL